MSDKDKLNFADSMRKYLSDMEKYYKGQDKMLGDAGGGEERLALFCGHLIEFIDGHGKDENKNKNKEISLLKEENGMLLIDVETRDQKISDLEEIAGHRSRSIDKLYREVKMLKKIVEGRSDGQNNEMDLVDNS